MTANSSMFPDLTEDLGSIDSDPQDDSAEEPEEPEERAAVGQDAQPPRRPRGRPRKAAPAQPAPASQVVPPLSPSLTTSNPAETLASRNERISKWRTDCPKDFERAWTWILAHMHEQEWSAGDIDIAIIRVTPAGGGNPQWLEPKIRGDQVQGEPEAGRRPGDAIMEWVVEYYHKEPGTPNTYKARFIGPGGEHIRETDPFRLEDWSAINRRRKRLQEVLEDATDVNDEPSNFGGGGGGIRITGRRPQQQQYALPVPVAQIPPPTPPVGSPSDPNFRMGWLEARNAALEAREVERAAAAAEGRMPREIPLPAPPAASQQEVIAAAVAQALEAAGVKPKGQVDIAAEIAKASAAAVAQALELAGIKPKTEADAQREREVAMMAQFSALLEARLGPAPTGAAGVPVVPGGPPPTMGEILLDAAKRKAAAEAEIAEAKKILNVQDPPVAPAEIVQASDEEDDDPWYVKIGKGVAQTVVQDPMGTLAGLAGFAAPFVEGSALGGLIAKGVAGAAEAAHAKKVRDSVTMPGTGVRKGGL